MMLARERRASTDALIDGCTELAAALAELPSGLLEIVADADQGAENYMALSYISKFGADAVRGGAWHGVFATPPSSVADFREKKVYKYLSRAEIDDVEREIRANLKIAATV